MREKIRRFSPTLPFVLFVLAVLAALNTYSSRSAELPAHSAPSAGYRGAGKTPVLPGMATPQEIYSDSVRTSQYVTVRDGTRLAVDIYRPAAGGVVVDKRFPVVLVATP